MLSLSLSFEFTFDYGYCSNIFNVAVIDFTVEGVSVIIVVCLASIFPIYLKQTAIRLMIREPIIPLYRLA